MRGPSGRGASRLARAGVKRAPASAERSLRQYPLHRVVRMQASLFPAISRTWLSAKIAPLTQAALPKRATAVPTCLGFWVHDETRVTNHGFLSKHGCFYPLNQIPALLFHESSVTLPFRRFLAFRSSQPAGLANKSNPKPGQQVFHETRDTNHETRLFAAPTTTGFYQMRGASQREFRGFHETRNTRHESRLFSRLGANATAIPPACCIGFALGSRNTRHETRNIESRLFIGFVQESMRRRKCDNNG